MARFIQTFIECYRGVTADIVVAAMIYIDRIIASQEDEEGEGGALLTE